MSSHLPIQQVTGAFGCLTRTPALVVPLDGVSPEAAARNLWAGKQAHEHSIEQVVHYRLRLVTQRRVHGRMPGC
jgi:hypothetical protein